MSRSALRSSMPAVLQAPGLTLRVPPATSGFIPSCDECNSSQLGKRDGAPAAERGKPAWRLNAIQTVMCPTHRGLVLGPLARYLLKTVGKAVRPPSTCSALRRSVRRLPWPLLTPAGPSQRLAAPLAHPQAGAGRQASQGKTRDLRPTYPPHLRPGTERLLCGSCSSGRGFAYSFLRTPPRGDALAVRLTVPVTRARRGLAPPSRRSADHLQSTRAHTQTRHAWHTTQRSQIASSESA